MGGHGGLNILPQKKWNVYNQDNRLKVEKIKEKIASTAKEAEQQAFSQKSYQTLRQLKKDQGHIEYDDNVEEVHELVKDQFINDTTQPLNQQYFALFEQEEHAYQQLQDPKKLFKDKPFVEDSRFAGNLADRYKRPWYMQKPSDRFLSVEEQKLRDKKDIEYQEVKDMDSMTYHKQSLTKDVQKDINFKFVSKPKQTDVSDCRNRSRSRHFLQDRSSPIQRDKEIYQRSIPNDDSHTYLVMEARQREAFERQRAADLLQQYGKKVWRKE